jgi:beta-galactosidase/beta-glucuronidase
MPVLCRLIALIVVFLALTASATVVPSEPSNSISLDGKWRFKLEQSDPVPTTVSISGKRPPIRLPEHVEPFEKPDYQEDGAWRDLTVPGNWEMAGCSPATYGQPDNAIGLYRLVFEVPGSWKNKIIKLNFDGVQNGAEIYLNGQPVDVSEPWAGRRNYHEGGYDAFQVDLTPAVKFGHENLLAVRVYKNTHSVDLDTGDYFFLGGIHRSVTLFSVEPTHIDDFTARTHLIKGGKAELRVLLDISNPKPDGKISVRLEGESPSVAAVNPNGPTEIVQTVEHPRLWSAEHPNLYTLSVNLIDAQGQTTEQLTRRIGIREVSIQDGVLLVNGTVVKLTGMCRHELDPALGSAGDATVWRRDLTLMRAANVNAIRTSHYPDASGFYDLCDEMGFYVADEMAACWVPTDTNALTPAFAQHARELVRRDKNHPSVILWAIGNENGPGKNNKVAADEIKRLDPTRPRLVSIQKPEVAAVEIDDAHYPSPARVAADVKDPRRSVYPMAYLENPNIWEERNGADYGSLDLWANVIDRAWTDIWRDDHLCGSFLWEWRDRAVADPGPVHLYDYDPVTGISLAKAKGLCDPFGNPRASYYQVKVVYAPIKVNLKPAVAGSTVVVHAVNHYSFTDVSELNTTWHLLANGAELARETVHPKLAPNSSADLSFQLPEKSLSKADVLKIDFDHPDGQNIVSYQLRLIPENIVPPHLDPVAKDITFPRLNLTTVTYAPNRIGWHWATRHPGALTRIVIRRPNSNQDVSINQEDLCLSPLADLQSVDADISLAEKTDVTVAHVHVTLNAGNFTYRFKWTGAPADIQELGWAFEVPKKEDRFSWHRQAYWSWYPKDHVGRPAGTATPDSADVHVTRITRPDAFDFNSTKYNCDWASLTDASGRGLGVVFDADNRHHCRGDFGPDGTCRLIVNKQASPPRDISSSVVPDLYLYLKNNMEVAGHFSVGALSASNETVPN